MFNSTILFLCTGNYYRSRFAEEYFNHLAGQRGLGWTASSKALAIDLGACNVGPISVHTRRALKDLGIALNEPVRDPAGVTAEDLQSATHVIALKEAEHRPYLSRKHSGWENRVQYWHVHDLDQAPADAALAEIEVLVRELVDRLEKESHEI